MYVFIAQYPVCWTIQSTLHFLPGRYVHEFWQLSISLGIIQPSCNFCTKISLTFPPLPTASTHLYTRVDWASWRDRKCPNFETVAKWIRTRVHSIASPTFNAETFTKTSQEKACQHCCHTCTSLAGVGVWERLKMISLEGVVERRGSLGQRTCRETWTRVGSVSVIRRGIFFHMQWCYGQIRYSSVFKLKKALSVLGICTGNLLYMKHWQERI